MPTGEVIDMAKILTNGTNYIAMKYFPKKNDINNAISDNFYWIDSDASGKPINSRVNAKNGYFNSYDDAIGNIPSGYTDVPSTDNFINEYVVSYLNMYPFDSSTLQGYPTAIDRTKSEYAEAVAKGAKEICVSVAWDSVFQTYSQQTTNSSTSWANYDALINYAKSLTAYDGKPVKVALRIVVSKDDSLHYDLEDPSNTNGWYGLSNSAKDQLGYVVRIAQGIGHVSLAYSTGLAQVYDFVTKTVQRYKSNLGSQFSWASVVFSSQDEDGYNYENRHYVGGSITDPYPAIYDYSSHAETAFKTWLASSAKYNGSISALNTAWGTSFANFAAVTLPGQGISGSHEYLASVYNDNKGKDWYEFNFKLIIDFLTACKSIINTEGVVFATEVGSNTDVLSPRRLTIDVPAFASLSTLHKAQLGGLSRDTSFAISIDVLRTNYANAGKKLGTELNTNDFVEQQGITDPVEMKNAMIECMQYCVNDAKARHIVVISTKQRPYFNVALDVIEATKNYMNNHSNRVPSTLAEFQYSVNQMLNNGMNWLRSQWAGIGGSLNNRVKMTQIANGTVEPPTCANPYQIYTIQQFCLSNNNLKSSYYSHNFESVKNTHALFSLPTHSISYVSGQLSKCDFKVTGNTDGIIYVSNKQFEGYIADGGALNNNHPRYVDNPAYNDDSVFVIPLGQSYTVEFTATTANAISATVEYMDINPAHDSPMVFRRKLSTSGTSVASFSFNPSDVGTNFIRQIKVNCNRISTTDTDSNIG